MLGAGKIYRGRNDNGEGAGMALELLHGDFGQMTAAQKTPMEQGFQIQCSSTMSRRPAAVKQGLYVGVIILFPLKNHKGEILK